MTKAKKMTNAKTAPAAPAPIARGRKPMAPEDRGVVGSLRLTPAEWDRFRELGGVVWLRERIAKARKVLQ